MVVGGKSYPGRVCRKVLSSSRTGWKLIDETRGGGIYLESYTNKVPYAGGSFGNDRVVVNHPSPSRMHLGGCIAVRYTYSGKAACIHTSGMQRSYSRTKRGDQPRRQCPSTQFPLSGGSFRLMRGSTWWLTTPETLGGALMTYQWMLPPPQIQEPG